MTADDSGAKERRATAPILRIYTLHRHQWAIVIIVALAIVVVNKAVIHDQGSSWFGLSMVAFYIGLATAHLAGRIGIAPRATQTNNVPS